MIERGRLACEFVSRVWRRSMRGALALSHRLAIFLGVATCMSAWLIAGVASAGVSYDNDPDMFWKELEDPPI